MNKLLIKYISCLVTIVMAFTLCGCFTGIESTKKIKMTREEKKSLEPTAEEKFLSDICPIPHTKWADGKEFVVVGDRGSVLFEPRRIVSGNYQLSIGDTLRYKECRMYRQPDGTSIPALTFSRGGDEFRYLPSGKADDREIMSDAIPGLVDPSMINQVADKMVGKNFWTRNSLREDEYGERVDGKRFEKIRVLNVSPGNMIFPIKVLFEDTEGRIGRMLLNFGNSGKDSRSFANMLQLSDPRKNYPSISDKIWENIMQGKVEIGMTRDECRLSKGNPTDVNSGHDYQHTLLIWSYSDGTVLYFVDGIVQGINSVPDKI
ncbi:MAG: hypothetical protein K2M31_00775 [Muribaculaceae bacterium]|nr:hypothetical protein [Muribaculaceae bacterium]